MYVFCPRPSIYLPTLLNAFIFKKILFGRREELIFFSSFLVWCRQGLILRLMWKDRKKQRPFSKQMQTEWASKQNWLLLEIRDYSSEKRKSESTQLFASNNNELGINLSEFKLYIKTKWITNVIIVWSKNHWWQPPRDPKAGL
jgi:hypothetical protein